ncbi:glycosyltransferase [Kocuria sp. M4R2S49]|uniref:glycosyltransferase family protein n=1 Tax=Kocuria rhizosphaericola TaxID=3376284 RepID=UPI0037881D1C
MFVYWKLEDAGSAHTIHHLARAARRAGHEIVLYAKPDPTYPTECSLDVESADAVVFLLEWNIYLHHDEPLDIEGPMRRCPRERRILIDNDGMYNDALRVDGDYNHQTPEDARIRTELYDRISDRIYQPTLQPRRPGVATYLFHGYDPALERDLPPGPREYGMVYVGSNWFRWGPMRRVLGSVEPIRDRIGRIRLIGHDWLGAPWWIGSPLRNEAYRTEPALLERLRVEVTAPVPTEQVVPTMSRAQWNPVLARPTFNHLRLVHPRLFETPAAGTIPLFDLDEAHVKDLYGEAALELVLGEDATDRIVDVLDRPGHYAAVVTRVRRHLAEHHSYDQRLRELINLVES